MIGIVVFAQNDGFFRPRLLVRLIVRKDIGIAHAPSTIRITIFFFVSTNQSLELINLQ
jgi:hypothetical protein